MAVFDVGPILEGVSSLQAKLEDAITKTKLLLEAIEGSQSKYKLTERNEDYPVLRSLKGRLAASQGPNESLSTELVKFKLELESFVEDIFQSHESFRTIKRNSVMHAKELELNRDKLCYEKGELAAERRELQQERKEFNALLRLAREKTPDEGNTNLNTVKESEKSLQQSEDSGREGNTEHVSAKHHPIEWFDAESQTDPEIKSPVSTERELKQPQDPNTSNAECQTEPEINLNTERKIKQHQDTYTSNAECQTEPISSVVEEQFVKRVQARNDTVNELFADSNESENTVEARHHRLLSGRPQTTCRAAVTGNRQRVATAPVSRAKALLLARQGHALRIHKTLQEDICQLEKEIQSLKLENTVLTKRANEATSELYYMKNQLTVSVADRDELQKKLHKYREQVQKLEDTLRKRAFGLVHSKKQQRQLEEELRWSQILAVPLCGSSSRTRGTSHEGKSTKER